jgi:hypothetical protein
VLAELEAHNAAIEAINLKKQMEEAEVRQDIVASVLSSPLHSYKLSKNKVIRDDGDIIR